MAEPLNIRAVRPYSNEAEFLDAEAWSVAARSILLIGAEAVPAGTAVRCELRLKGGSALIVAEGTAVKYAEATPTRPAGLVVRYKRMSSTSSDFVKRAVAHTTNRTGSSPIAASSPSAASLPPAAPRHTSSVPPTHASPLLPKVHTAGLSSRPPGRSSNSRPAPRPAADARPSAPPSKPRRSTKPPATATLSSKSKSRHSTKPPTTDIESTPPSKARRSTQPPGTELSPSTPAPKSRRSGPPAKHSVAASSRSVPTALAHDSNAMQRLRARSGGKQITLPPDRDAVLARLKKQRREQ